MKSISIAAAALIGSGVSGCVPVIGTLTLNDLMTGTSLMTTALTGKSLSDHALSAATGEDCSLMDAVFEEDRHICEVNGSKVTQNEFKGLIGMSKLSAAQPQPQPAADTPVAADIETDTGADAVTASGDASVPRGVSLALAAQANSARTSAAGNAGSASDAGTSPTIDLNLVNILTGSGDNTGDAR